MSWGPMELMRLMQEGGWGAFGAAGLGLMGAVLGVLAVVLLLARNRSALGVGVAAVLLGALAAGVGMAGAFFGKRMVVQAMAMVGSGVDAERIVRLGFKEAQGAALVGFGASVLPILLGALGAVLGSRLRREPQRRVGLPEEASADEGVGATMMAAVVVALALLASAGAYAMARAPLPVGRYPFDDGDEASWQLARALELVERSTEREAVDRACRELEDALRPFWQPADEREWPRALTRQPHAVLAPWRDAADRCVRHALDSMEEGAPPGQTPEWRRDELFASPLLHSPVLRQRALEPPAETEVPPPPPPSPGGDTRVLGSLSSDVVRGVIKANLARFRRCYEQALKLSPDLEGKLQVRFVVAPDGHVAQAAESSSPPFPSATVRECVLDTTRSLVFPKPAGGGVVVVVYPFVFKTAR